MTVPQVAEIRVETPEMTKKSSISHAHAYQSTTERTTAQGHCDDIRAKPAQIAMTAEGQDAAIRQAFTNEDTFPQEKELRQAIGKNRPSLVHPRERALLHRAAKLIDAYSKDGCPADCGANWTREQIEAAIR